MVNILRSKKYKLNPVTRAVLILSGFALWTILSTFINTKSQNQDVHTAGRNLLALEETSNAELGEELGAAEVVSSAPAPEEVTRVEVVGSGNASSEHCIQPAVTQFPSPILHKEQRKQGGVILHVVVAFYMFIGLAIVCEDYFVPSLNRVSDALGLSPDVAGATFMAAGSSAPELATSVIGAFVAKDDIGVGSVVGSAVFNITLVVAVCSLSATHAIQLSWYSVCR